MEDVALGNISSLQVWNKFGYNAAFGIGTEVVASFGGTYGPLLVAAPISFVSTSSQDETGGTGCAILVITGVDSDWKTVTEIVGLTGTTPVVTGLSYFGIDRVAVYLCGSSLSNVGTITGTETGGSTTQAQLPAGEGTTQQMIYTTPEGGTAMLTDLIMNVIKTGSGAAPTVDVKGWVYSHVSQAKYEIFRYHIDTSHENHLTIHQQVPFIMGEKSVIWFEATTDKANTEITMRMSFLEHE